jgi:hypothetical protein
MRKAHFRTRQLYRNIEKHGKLAMHTSGQEYNEKSEKCGK